MYVIPLFDGDGNALNTIWSNFLTDIRNIERNPSPFGMEYMIKYALKEYGADTDTDYSGASIIRFKTNEQRLAFMLRYA